MLTILRSYEGGKRSCHIYSKHLLRVCAIPVPVRSCFNCVRLCSLIDCSPPGSCDRGILPGKNPGVGCHALLQGVFPIQGSNPGLSCKLLPAPPYRADEMLDRQACDKHGKLFAFPLSKGGIHSLAGRHKLLTLRITLCLLEHK